MALVIFSQIERNARAHVQSMVYCIWGLGIHILNMSGPKKVLKSIHFEKATKFCEIFPLLLTSVHTVKSKGKISQNVLAFSEYMNFTYRHSTLIPSMCTVDSVIGLNKRSPWNIWQKQ